MKIIITGATGMIGAEVVRQAIDDPSIEQVILLVRNQSELIHPKIKTLLHKDFLNYPAAKEPFTEADALIWCLGISQTQVSRKQYEIITYDYVVACAGFCKEVNPELRFVFVSGDGADKTEKSRVLFKRIKGKAENALMNSGLKKVIIARPGAVKPKYKNKNAPFTYKLLYPLFSLIETFSPDKIIGSDTLAKALLALAKNGNEKHTLENIALKALGKT